MNQSNWRSLLAVSAMLLAHSALSQDVLRGTLTMGMGDVAVIKQKAEAGDAAAQGNVEGEYHVGDMLLFGASGIPNKFTVRANQTEGIRWTFMAATNFHAYACRNMAKALRHGLGTGTNLVAAYAWFSLLANIPPGFVSGRYEMNELALQLDTGAIQQAQNLAAQFKAGNWQAPVPRAIPEGDPRLKLGGITFGGRALLAVINGKTLSEGESATVSVKPGTLTLKCLKIEKDSVLITVEGEGTPRRLHLR